MEQRVLETRRLLTTASATLLGIGLVVGLSTLFGRANHMRLASDALANGDFPAACSFADQALRARPGDVRSILVGAEAAEQNSELQRAVGFLMRLPATAQDHDVRAGWLRMADLQTRLGQFTPARTTYETILKYAPSDPVATRRLAALLCGCGYRFDALPLLRRLVAANEADIVDLVRLALNGNMLFGQQQLERANELCPNDPMAIVGLMIHKKKDLDAVGRQSLLKETLALTSTSTPLRIQVLKFRLETAAPAEFAEATVEAELLGLLSSADTHPGTWRMAAQWAQRHRLPLVRLRCLMESVVCDRWSLECVHALSEALRENAMSSEHSAEVVMRLKTIHESARRVYASPDDLSHIEQVAASLHSMGRFGEAKAWARIALRRDSSAVWARALMSHTTAHIGRTEPTHPAPLSEMYRDFAAELPLPHEFLRRDVTSLLPRHSAVRFMDTSSSAGVSFLYRNGVVPGQEGLRMHQWTGGGVGVLDIDADSWPDLYFSQGRDAADSGHSSGACGGMYRNLRGDVFDDVSHLVRMSATIFGQGVAIGDINNDGFDDLYVAGTGRNTLQLNQGDGTFQEVWGFEGSAAWTTSVAIADLNGDSQPDIYDVNYVGGANVFLQTCDHEGRYRVCGPHDFPAESDRVFFSDGSGGYSDVTAESGFNAVPGRGMGVVVGDIQGHGTNQVFVANDESQNFLYTRRQDSVRFTENGFAAGAAFDKYGAAQGSMGIAIGDIDGNHRPDLFVTNYYAESNILYSQQHSSGFIDDTAAFDLAMPGYLVLGFGCQFLDADADGDPDLVVANGHLDDFTHMGHRFRMRPHFYENTGNGCMVEAEAVGDYFETPVLGRSVAMLDWNGDGCCDVVVTHLDSAAALLTNRTPQMGSISSFKLIGIRAARDAVGGSASWSSASGPAAWRMAGDGYQCSNEPVLRLSHVAQKGNEGGMTVTWPGGRITSVGTVAVGRRYAVVEDRPFVYALPR
ncbi:MAG: FG-GAP-like repeat-containing protein [Fuerstiella sp.]|nr:FG-GAP-like repeat-containing protein [Fuerstiella sp.]